MREVYVSTITNNAEIINFFRCNLSIDYITCFAYSLKAKKWVFHIYHEGIGAKLPNEVNFFHLDYTEKYVP